MVIQIKVTGIKELSNKFNKLQKNMPKTALDSVKEVLKFGRKRAKDLAPTKTGDLKSNIRYKTFKNKEEVSGILMSSVSKEFPYNFWVNEMPGYKYATLAKRRTPSGAWPNRATRARWPKIYTQKRMYRTCNITGTPGYFTKAINDMEEKFPKLVGREIKNTIKRSGFR